MPKLHSYFTYQIITYDYECSMRTIEMWYNYTQNSNSVTKLCYQFKYKTNEKCYYICNTKWNYIKGPTYFDNDIMNTAIRCRDLELVESCLMGGVIPNELSMLTDYVYGNLKSARLLEKYIQANSS